MTKEEMFNQNINIAYKISQSYRINYMREYDDIRQIALMALWQAVLKYDGRGSLTTYAYPCVRNAINIYIRKLKKHSNEISLQEQIDDNLYLEDTISDEEIMEEKILDKYEYIDICNYANNLPIEGRDKLIWDLYSEGFTQMKIAEKLNLSQSYVSRLLTDIKKLIKNNYLNKEYIWTNQ